MTQRPPEHAVLDDAWNHIVGGIDWLKSVLLGEFADHRPLSAVVADMLASFVPCVVIVTSARDAAAVILRLANHPEKREELMEWVLLCSCLIVIALPLAMAAGGVAAAGVGAIAGGIAGSELGAALRAVMLMLIKEAQKLVELVRFLQKFIHGDVLKFLRSVKFVQYEKALVQAVDKITGQLLQIAKSLRSHLESLHYFDSVKATIATLSEWETRFYAVQQDALRHVPRALAELDARLAHVLALTAPKEAHTVAAGVQADKTAAAVPVQQRVRDTPGKVLPKVEEVAPPAVAERKDGAKPNGEVAQKAPATPPKENPDPVKPTDPGTNGKKQMVADPAAAADRERIAQLSKEGKIVEARAILQPYVNAAKEVRTSREKEAMMEAIIARLDVTSHKEKMFWSGDKEIAAKIARKNGKTILEQTPGGMVIDQWPELDEAFPWRKEATRPNGWDFWGEVSANYSRDVVGEIDVVQAYDVFPKGGDTWRGRELPVIRKEGKVNLLNIFGVNKNGEVLDVLKIDPNGHEAKEIFGGQ